MLSSACHVEPYARNEDRAVAVRVGSGLVVAVIDGAGGMPRGSEAAELVARRVAAEAGTLGSAAAIAALLFKLDGECERDARGEAAAAVLLVGDDGAIEGASVGDCEAWIVRGTGVERLTSEQHRRKRLGSGRVEPARFTSQLSDGAIIVASDGLFGYASESQIAEAAKRPDVERVALNLIEAAKGPPVPLADDLAVVVVRAG